MSVGEAASRTRDQPRRGFAATHREGVRLLVAGEELPNGVQLREADDGSTPVMYGHFTPFNRWTEINSFFEGHFMERTVKGAFKKTIREDRGGMRSLFQHGRDGMIGSKPLGPIDMLREEDFGPYYEVGLLDADYVRDTLLPGLRAGLYGASYRFRVMREEIVDDPGRSEHNPNGIQERTIKEAKVFEFGPVTFPAYPDASAGVRGVTDELFLDGVAAADPELVRAVAEGADFTELIARRLGYEPVEEGEREEEEEGREEEEEQHEEREEEQAQTNGTGGAVKPPIRRAAPGTRPTPLRGPKRKANGRLPEPRRSKGR